MVHKPTKTIYLSGTLWVDRRMLAPMLDIYSPNHPASWAILETIDGKPHLCYAESAPRDFKVEVQEHLDKLKTLLILGG